MREDIKLDEATFVTAVHFFLRLYCIANRRAGNRPVEEEVSKLAAQLKRGEVSLLDPLEEWGLGAVQDRVEMTDEEIKRIAHIESRRPGWDRVHRECARLFLKMIGGETDDKI
jgi:hypothetical protein